MTRFPWFAAFIALVCALFFLVPLGATINFSLRMKRGEITLDAYAWVFRDAKFLEVLGFSALASLAAIILGALLVVPTAYWVRLKLPSMRPMTEFLVSASPSPS